MSGWNNVGDWIKANAGPGAALIGSLLTGNVPGAVAAGVAMVSGVTGTADPEAALGTLRNNPEAVVRLRELAVQEEQSIRNHIQEMTRLELEDAQHEHATTQATVKAGDRAQDRFVRWTRPGQSWISLIVALCYAFSKNPDSYVLGLLLALPFAYAGLRQVGKGIDSIVTKQPNH